MKETYPLKWPEGWPRTSLREREERRGWKKTERQSVDDLEKELKLFGAFGAALTRKDPQDIRTAEDPSVAVYFSRRREDDFAWQTALEISNPAPTLDEIENAYRILAKKHHTDKAGGDLEMMIALNAHRKSAVAYANRLSGVDSDLTLACDRYKQTRWNIMAISNTVYSLRQMERDGTSRLLDRALSGFAALKESNDVRA